MHPIPRFLTIVLMSMLLLSVARPGFAQEAAAGQAAEDILRSFAGGKFKNVWDQKVSKFLKDRVPEDVFLANMSMGRPQLGALNDLKLVSTQHLNQDPQSGFVGDIYFVVFRTTYTTGEYYEQVAVVKDADGEYRYSGIYGTPVPKN